jgi:carbon starvation protein CstA
LANPAVFDVIWRYFAWSNQVLAMVTLWTITVYLYMKKKPYIITLLPAMFMTMVTSSFLFVAEREGLGTLLPRWLGYTLGAIVMVGITIVFFVAMSRRDKKNIS